MPRKRKRLEGKEVPLESDDDEGKVDSKEGKEEPTKELIDGKEEEIEKEKPKKKKLRKKVPKRPIDGDPESKFLCERYLSLFKELRPEDNPGIDLRKVTCGSHQVLNWWCSVHETCEKHLWKAPVFNRVDGNGCPYCTNGARKKWCNCTRPSFENEDGSRKAGQENMKRCSNCYEEKTNSQFAADKNSKDRLNCWCNECMKKIRSLKSAIMRLYLEGKKCQDCGEENEFVLEFDHVNDDKEQTQNGKPRAINSLSPQKMCLEFKKTEIVCIWCHRIRTHSRYLGVESTHCKQTLLKRAVARKLKLERKCCSVCPREITEETVRLYDLDHIDPSTKIMAVSTMINDKNYTVKDVEAEVAKCQLLCCTCHRFKTAVDGKWRKVCDFSDEILAKARTFLDQHFQKDYHGHYIHIKPIKQSN